MNKAYASKSSKKKHYASNSVEEKDQDPSPSSSKDELNIFDYDFDLAFEMFPTPSPKNLETIEKDTPGSGFYHMEWYFRLRIII